jgi:hypothetical protein
MNEETIHKAQLRGIQYWFEDGLAEIGTGGLFLLLGLYFYLQATLEKFFWGELLSGAFILIFLGGWYLAGRFVRTVKERITFPRTGYVAYQRNKNRKRPLRLALTLITASLFSGASIVLVSKRPLGMDIMPIVNGLTIAFVFGLMAFRTGLARLYLPAAIGLLCGLALSLNGTGNITGLALDYMATAFTLIASGVIVLRRYLNSNPGPEQAQQ